MQIKKFQSITQILYFYSNTAPIKKPQIKKFYQKATIEKNQNPKHKFHIWQIKLDGKEIKTPGKNIVALPSVTLANLVANEFNMQGEFLRPSTMPLLSLSRTAIDMDFDFQLRMLFEKQTMAFLENDTLLFREADGTKLNKIQNEKLNPIIKKFENKFTVKLPINYQFDVKKLRKEDSEKIEQLFNSLNNWELMSIENQAENLKSTCLSILLWYSIIDVKTAVQLSRLEEEYQILLNGFVEGHHDVDENTVMMNTSAAKLFSTLLIDQNIVF